MSERSHSRSRWPPFSSSLFRHRGPAATGAGPQPLTPALLSRDRLLRRRSGLRRLPSPTAAGCAPSATQFPRVPAPRHQVQTPSAASCKAGGRQRRHAESARPGPMPYRSSTAHLPRHRPLLVNEAPSPDDAPYAAKTEAYLAPSLRTSGTAEVTSSRPSTAPSTAMTPSQRGLHPGAACRSSISSCGLPTSGRPTIPTTTISSPCASSAASCT